MATRSIRNPDLSIANRELRVKNRDLHFQNCELRIRHAELRVENASRSIRHADGAVMKKSADVLDIGALVGTLEAGVRGVAVDAGNPGKRGQAFSSGGSPVVPLPCERPCDWNWAPRSAAIVIAIGCPIFAAVLVVE
jgi:hypothetical protein